MAHLWVNANEYSGVPPNAVFAGQDTDGDYIYVGRAYHEGDQLPAKIMLNKRVGYVPYGGNEIVVQQYEVLCGQGYQWLSSGGGSIPEGAVVGGQTSDGEPLYIGRGHYEGSLTPGKVQCSHGCLYIPYGGAEHKLDQYDVLCSLNVWVSSSSRAGIPQNAVFAGQDSDGDPIYVGRSYYEGDQLPVKVIPNKGTAYVPFGGQEVPIDQFDVLCGNGFTWVGSSSGHVPSGAVTSGNTANGEPLYIGRGHFQGSLTPGKIHPSHGCLYIPYGGAEHSLSQYEVLVRSSF